MNAAERAALLQEGALAIGALWAKTWCERMRREGRELAGGWPGTVDEARHRVRVHFAGKLACSGMEELRADELTLATRAVYASAKRNWLNAQSVPRRRRRAS